MDRTRDRIDNRFEADQHLLALFAWGFIVPAIWGFNARWLPAFLGLPKPRERIQPPALAISTVAIAAAWFGLPLLFALLASFASLAAVLGLRVFEKPLQPPSLGGTHATFPTFVRLAYVWLLVAAALPVWAAGFDRAGGIWGASRHALTVGFISTMIFSIGQRILPAFSGVRLLFSPKWMFLSLLPLNAGCSMRVAGEIPAYEAYLPGIWPVLPFSAVVEMTAFTRPPARCRLPSGVREWKQGMTMTRRVGMFLKVASLFAGGAVLFYGIKHRTRRRAAAAFTAALPDIVEEASIDSFPASDPPSWTSAALL